MFTNRHERPGNSHRIRRSVSMLDLSISSRNDSVKPLKKVNGLVLMHSNAIEDSIKPMISASVPSSSASEVPVPSLIRSHSLLVTKSQSRTAADLSEQFSQIKKALRKESSVELVKDTQPGLEILLQAIKEFLGNKYINALYVKGLYLNACCLFYLEIHGDKLNLNACKAASDALAEARTYGFQDSLNATVMINDYYNKSKKIVDGIILSESIYSKLDFLRDGQWRIETLLVNELKNLERHYGVAISALSQFPKRIANDLLNHALDLDKNYSHARVITPR